MCIIIDTCAFHKVFDPKDKDFSPVKKWISVGKGRLVFGGSKYEKELGQMKVYLRLVSELSRRGRVIVIDKSKVDADERRVRALEDSPDFDDCHIVAIVETSGCKVVCTVDSRSDRFITDRKFYVNSSKPKIYRSKSHASLLKESNIAAVCRRG